MKSAEKSTTTTAPTSGRQPFFGKNGGTESFFAATGVQAKMAVNTPGDTFEQEADATADQVMRMPAPAPEQKEEPSVQRKEKEEAAAMRTSAPEAEKVQRKEQEPEQEMVQRTTKDEEVQRQCTDCEEETPPADTIQRTEAGSSSGGTTAPPIVSQVVSGGGTPLDGGTRGFMESRFGSDFSGVRVHTDTQAAESAQSISAHAYTFNNHIVFDQGQYNPQTEGGKHLLAHELTHVVQQGGDIKRRVNPAARNSGTATGNTAPGRPGGTRPAQTTATAHPPGQSPVITPPAPATPTTPAPAAEAPASAPPPPAGGAGGAAAPPPAPVPLLSREPLVPEAPETLTPAAQQRLNQAQGNAARTGTAAANLPTEADSTAGARGAVTEPAAEADARASGALAAALGERPAPSPEIEAICENIRRVIREQRPPDEDSLLQADPEAAANEAGNQVNDNVSNDADRVGSEYDSLEQTPAGTPEQIGQEPAATPEGIAAGSINAAQATPDAIPAEEVSLDNDVANTAASMEAAGMNTEPAQLVQDGPIAEARDAHGELDTAAQADPAEVLAQQDTALGTARADMEALQAQALQALQQSRSGTIAATGTQQTGMTGTEEQMRAELGRQAEEIFTNAQTQVNTLLEPLTRTAMEMWNTGKTRLSTEFEQHLARVQSWVDERHEGVGGAIVGLWDDIAGMPDWVTEEYNDAERDFGDGVCDLIREISSYVNGIVATCEQLIDGANEQIATLFANAPGELGEWAAAEQERFRTRLEGMRENVHTTQQNFNRDLANSAAEAVQEVRQQVHALREKAKGLIGRIADAIGDFLDDPVRFIINGLLSLVGIEPARFWALVNRIAQVISDIAADPLGFASNLLSAIGAGFQRFFDNIGTHLFNGLINWLLSGLGAVGVQIPRDFSLGSIITFFLQLMGITWDRVRMLLARHIGEENVALIEQAFGLVADLIELGPEGIFQLIEDQLDPQHILDTIIQMAIDFLRDALITQITARILLLFNPVGAIAQAIEAIYRVLRWIFENAARIFTLVETVVNGIADILAGNIGGMAQAVETALAGLITPVIDFLASYAGLGNLPERIADAVRGLQSWVEGILNRVIGFLARQARSVLAAMGIGGEEGEEEGDGSINDETAQFEAGGERHRLYYVVSNGRRTLTMASNPQNALSFLAGLPNTADATKKSQAQQLATWLNSVPENTPESEVDQKMEQLGDLIGQLMGTDIDGSASKPFHIKWHKPYPHVYANQTINLKPDPDATNTIPVSMRGRTTIEVSNRRVSGSEVDNERAAGRLDRMISTAEALLARTDGDRTTAEAKESALHTAHPDLINYPDLRSELGQLQRENTTLGRSIRSISTNISKNTYTPTVKVQKQAEIHSKTQKQNDNLVRISQIKNIIQSLPLDELNIIERRLQMEHDNVAERIAQNTRSLISTLQQMKTELGTLPATNPDDLATQNFTLGVDSRFLVRENTIVGPILRTSDVRNTQIVREFTSFLRAAGYDDAGMQMDHVTDLSLGGPDDFSNLWPLSASENRDPSQQINPLTGKEDGGPDSESIRSNKFQGKYLIIKDTI